MKVQKIGAATVLVVALGLGNTAAGAQDSQGSQRSRDAQGVTGTSIVEQLRHELLQLPSYGVYDFVSFAYDRGTVTLTGYASDVMLRPDAEEAVRRVPGVNAVVDKVEILRTSMADEGLRARIYYAIFNDPFIANYMSGGTLLWGHTHAFVSDRLLPLGPMRFPGTEPVGTYPIHIIVKQGHVTLLGVVDSESDKIQAGVLAQKQLESFDVENELTVDIQP
jgi:hyperosmotically inducible protein